MTSRYLFTAIGASAACLAWAWFANRDFIVAIIMVVMGVAWLGAALRRVRWAASVGLIGAILAAASGVLRGVAAIWLLPGLALALAAWDLTDFARRLDFAAQPEDRPALERIHITRLGLMLLIGLVLSELALRLTGVHVTFEWTLLFIFLGAWGLSTLIGWLRTRGNS